MHGGGAVLGTQYRLPLPQPNTGFLGLFDPLASRSANSRALHVDRGEKTMAAKRKHTIRKAFEFILEIYVTN